VSDITYIRTGEGWLYLCMVMDLFSRQIIGWAMESYLTQALVQQAFTMAYHHTQPGQGVILSVYVPNVSCPVKEKGLYPKHEWHGQLLR
jgi:transposase InsO family protein